MKRRRKNKSFSNQQLRFACVCLGIKLYPNPTTTQNYDECGKVIAELKRHYFTRFEEDKGGDMYYGDYSRTLQEP